MSFGQSQATKNTITLKGSATIVSEFFGFAINSILYQRGIYDPTLFKPVKKYGLPMQVTMDEGLSSYLDKINAQMQSWLEQGMMQKMVLVVTSVDTQEVMERWQFDVQTDKKAVNENATFTKPEKEITKEIQAIIRQITSSVTFLPLLEVPCTFDLLLYTDNEATVPQSWEDSDPCYINNSNQVRLRSFTTKIHQVSSMVAYRTEDDDMQM